MSSRDPGRYDTGRSSSRGQGEWRRRGGSGVHHGNQCFVLAQQYCEILACLRAGGGGGRNKEYSKLLLTHCGACKEWSKEEMVSGADANDVEFLLINGAEERVATPAATQHYQPLPRLCPP